MARESQAVINQKIFGKLESIVEKIDSLQETSSKSLAELSTSNKDVVQRIDSLANQYTQFKYTQEYKNKEFDHHIAESDARIITMNKEITQIAELIGNIKFFLKNWRLVSGGMILTVLSAIASVVLNLINRP
jgi:RNA processing factor Prp31